MLNLTDFLPSQIAIVLYIGIMTFTTIYMEGVTRLLHRFVINGFGWSLHEDHHRYTEGSLQKNDTFAGILSLLTFMLIFINARELNILFRIGLGVAIYGLGYFVFHYVWFHKKIKTKYKPKSSYMKKIFILTTIKRAILKDQVNRSVFYMHL